MTLPVLRHLHARLAFALVALAMLVRAVVPSGYMFAPSADGEGLVVQLCSGVDTRWVSIDPATGAMTEADAPGPDTPAPTPAGAHDCPFATAAAPLLPALAGVLVPPATGPPLRASPAVFAAVPAARAGAPLPARGPPLSA